jgi:DNA-directed RNA polymerase beta subunit
VCNQCGFLAEPPAPKTKITVLHKTAYCRYCKSHDFVHRIQVPYAFKLFSQELMALHIAPCMELGDV